MKRHENLKALSREHHQALVLASTLHALAEPVTAEFIAAAKTQWLNEMAPHFALEERELLPLSDCGDSELRQHAAQIRSEHKQLKQGFDSLDAHTSTDAIQALGALLREHVRFEERTWFPKLETSLDGPTLARLEHRLQLTPAGLIVGFHQDEEQHWVATLDCGHTRHFRHKPPFHNAPWTQSKEGREDMLQTPVPCPPCRMPRLPTCAKIYKETRVFDNDSVPAGLLKTHSVKSGTWGQIVVLEGMVHYVMEDEDLTVVLRPAIVGIIAPTRPHRVIIQPGARFKVQFSRC